MKNDWHSRSLLYCAAAVCVDTIPLYGKDILSRILWDSVLACTFYTCFFPSDNGCRAVFEKTHCYIEQNGEKVLYGVRDKTTKLWKIPLHTSKGEH